MNNLKEELASSNVMNKQIQERCEQLEGNRSRVTKESLLSDSDVQHSQMYLRQFLLSQSIQ